MSILRRLTIAFAALALVATATPALAQDNPAPTPNQLRVAMPTFVAPNFALPTFAKTVAPPKARRGQNQQGLGVFFQIGWVSATTWGANGEPTGGFDNRFNGYLIGIGFGGNKSGHFGIGVDINYIVRGADNVQFTDFDEIFEEGKFTQHILQVPVYGRINFFGTSTKNAPTLYALIGGFVDILLKAKINSFDIKNQFNGLDVGVLFGAGFEVARIGVEFRGDWALRTLQNTGGNTFLNGLEDSKVFTFIILFRVRLN